MESKMKVKHRRKSSEKVGRRHPPEKKQKTPEGVESNLLGK